MAARPSFQQLVMQVHTCTTSVPKCIRIHNPNTAAHWTTKSAICSKRYAIWYTHTYTWAGTSTMHTAPAKHRQKAIWSPDKPSNNPSCKYTPVPTQIANRYKYLQNVRNVVLLRPRPKQLPKNPRWRQPDPNQTPVPTRIQNRYKYLQNDRKVFLVRARSNQSNKIPAKWQYRLS